jgi:methylthioribose-1-phosphate isomerase
MTNYRSIEWLDNGAVRMLDQRVLPQQISYLEYTDCDAVAEAIREMVIRGAPAIGAAAGYGLALAAQNSQASSAAALRRELDQAAARLRQARPTAVNLFWAVDRVLARVKSEAAATVDDIRRLVLEEAHAIAREDVETNRQIGLNALPLIPDGARIVHHCNTGALATTDYGTALGVIRTAHEHGKGVFVYVDETRPRLQGARLTAWELQQLGVPHAVIVDGASGFIMKERGVDLVTVGCDRVAANGDTANKIGTYNLALVARAHGVPFYVVGPTSTIDLSCPTGKDIRIEERPADEVTRLGAEQLAPEGTQVVNPAFDVTPNELITAIITEAGVAYPPFTESLSEIVRKGREMHRAAL